MAEKIALVNRKALLVALAVFLGSVFGVLATSTTASTATIHGYDSGVSYTVAPQLPAALSAHRFGLSSTPRAASTLLPRRLPGFGVAAKAADEVVPKLGFTAHGADRLAERGVRTPDALDAFRNPLRRGEITYDELGRPTQVLTGRRATIVINPETNKIVTGYPTSRRLAAKLLRQLGDAP